jgi:hypothetical protein
MTQLTLTHLSDNEVSLGNTSDIEVLYRGNTYALSIGGTLYFEDAGQYEIRTIQTEAYESAYFNVVIGNRVPDDGTPGRVVINRQAELQALKSSMLTTVDAEAETFRHQFITPGAGQAMTYEEKYAEALAYLANTEIDEDEIPHIVAEVGITGADKMEVAQAIVTVREQWRVLSASIEKVRLGQKKLIGEAVSVEALHTVPAVDWSTIGAA